ncbi:MAG: hypothetical protein KDK28_14980, partial [Maritimibacter sp.]|nr:hypothetical protein [Maritimibacter sp.]
LQAQGLSGFRLHRSNSPASSNGFLTILRQTLTKGTQIHTPKLGQLMAGRILIADTTPAGRTVLKAKLAAARYEILEADSREDLHARVQRERPDMVILGSQRPGKTGAGGTGTDARATCRQLKADPDTRSIPVIVIDADPTRSARL